MKVWTLEELRALTAAQYNELTQEEKNDLRRQARELGQQSN